MIANKIKKYNIQIQIKIVIIYQLAFIDLQNKIKMLPHLNSFYQNPSKTAVYLPKQQIKDQKLLKNKLSYGVLSKLLNSNKNHNCYKNNLNAQQMKQKNIIKSNNLKEEISSQSSQQFVYISQPYTFNSIKTEQKTFTFNQLSSQQSKITNFNGQTVSRKIMKEICQKDYYNMYMSIINNYKNTNYKINQIHHIPTNNETQANQNTHNQVLLSQILSNYLSHIQPFSLQQFITYHIPKKTTKNKPKKQSIKIQQHNKTNNNLLKKINKVQNNTQANNKNDRDTLLQYIDKIYKNKRNLFKLIPMSCWVKNKKDMNIDALAHKTIAQEFMNQMVSNKHRFNKIYLQDNQKQTNNTSHSIVHEMNRQKLQKIYQNHRQISNIFISHQFHNIKIANLQKSNQNNIQTSGSQHKQKINKLIIQKYCNQLQSSLAMQDRNQRGNLCGTVNSKNFVRKGLINKKKQKIIDNQRLNKMMHMKIIQLVCGIQSKAKGEPNFIANSKQAKNEILKLQTQLSNKTKQISSSIKQYLDQLHNTHLNNFINYYDNHFRKQPILQQFYLSQTQLNSYINYLSQVHKNYQIKQNKNMSLKITGKMIYQIQQKIYDISKKQQVWIKAVLEITRIRRMLGVRNAQLPMGQNNTKMNRNGINRNRNLVTNHINNSNNIDILRKLKKQPTFSCTQNTITINKSFSYSNRLLSQSDLSSQNHKNANNTIQNKMKNYNIKNEGNMMRNANILEIQTNKRNYNFVQSGNDRKMKTLQKKKQQLQQYINNLCKQDKQEDNQHFSKYTHHPKTNNIQISPERNKQYFNQTIMKNNYHNNNQILRNNKTNKFIKYSRYPIQFGKYVQFCNQNFQQCVIVYYIQEINVKALTLLFMEHRRKFSINKVKIYIRSLRQYAKDLKQIQQGQKQSGLAKIMKVMQILNCLGAQVTIQQEKPYQILDKKQYTVAQLVAFTLRQNIQKIYHSYNKMFSQN